MIIKSDKIQEIAQKILSAVDNNEISVLTDTLELKTVNNLLYLNLTNKEYYISVNLQVNTQEEFHATVNATVFLKLITQITTPDIELSLEDRIMIIKGNGIYKLPLIFEDDKLLELPEIIITNSVKSFPISTDILSSILTYNSKELLRGTISRPIQRLFYIDEQGAITFTSGACVNSFNLVEPVKILLNSRVVKLFKLFQSSEVKFTLGYDALSEDIIQTKVKFESDNIILTSIISCDDTLINSVPVNAIRGRANAMYEYSIVLNRDALLQTINRLMLFTQLKNTLKPYSLFQFDATGVTIWDSASENKETINYVGNGIDSNYEVYLDLVDLKSVIDTCTEDTIIFNFGNKEAIVLARGNIKNIIPEIHSV